MAEDPIKLFSTLADQYPQKSDSEQTRDAMWLA